ncbi:hypothetical protein WME90_23845 [Sorangium sp. So ce375]|uniref:hypothetical protein n=1 Tax=Sorangium sp. So ce375 TaxID=3133306 RepID=UPI003F5B0178
MRIVRSAFAFVALFAAGCAVESADPDLMVDAPPLSESWIVSNLPVNATWDSGLVANLSPSRYIHCHDDYGPGYMLTSLTVFQEPVATPADFIARMTASCRDYDLLDPALPWTGASMTKPIFAAPSVGPGPFSIQVPANDSYPIGLQLRVSGGGTHVKDVRIKYAHKDATGMALDVAAPAYTSWAIGYAGTIVNLDCPNQQVLTGFDLNNDVVAGPIRYLQTHCRDLQY